MVARASCCVAIRDKPPFLNDKISQRFPTFVLMGDFYFLAIIIIAYSLNVTDSINRRTSDQPDAISAANLSALYIVRGYFLFREIIQMISLISLKSFHIWVYDSSNWLNVAFIILVLYWSILMNTGGGDLNNFRVGTAITVIVLWLKVLAFLRNMLIDFAVFSGGVFYVFRRLVAFLTALTIILVGSRANVSDCLSGYPLLRLTLFQTTILVQSSSPRKLPLIAIIGRPSSMCTPCF
jgi:hypothetical protein